MNLSHEVNEAIERAVVMHSHRDEQVGYLANLTVVSNDAGLPTTITVVALRMNAAVPGEYITKAFFVDTPIPAFEDVQESIAKLLMEMRTARVAHMRQILQQADADTGERGRAHDAMECDDEGCMQPHEIN